MICSILAKQITKPLKLSLKRLTAYCLPARCEGLFVCFMEVSKMELVSRSDDTAQLVHACRSAQQFISRAFRNDLLSSVTIGPEAKALADEFDSDTMPDAEAITEVRNSLLYVLARVKH